MLCGSLDPILCLFSYMCLCVCEMWDRHKQTDKLTNMKAAYPSSVRHELPNIWRQRFPVLWAWRWKTKKSDFSRFLLRHRKLPESCQEQEGLISSGSDSPELVSLSFTTAKESAQVTLYPVPVYPEEHNTIHQRAALRFLRGLSLLIRLNRSAVDRNNVGGALSPCSLCTDIFYCCCVNSCGHAAEDVAPANSFSAG